MLRDVDLPGADLSGADRTRAEVHDSDLSSTDLSSTDLCRSTAILPLSSNAPYAERNAGPAFDRWGCRRSAADRTSWMASGLWCVALSAWATRRAAQPMSVRSPVCSATWIPRSAATHPSEASPSLKAASAVSWYVQASQVSAARLAVELPRRCLGVPDQLGQDLPDGLVVGRLKGHPAVAHRPLQRGQIRLRQDIAIGRKKLVMAS